jgi:hypothetical protein
MAKKTASSSKDPHPPAQPTVPLPTFLHAAAPEPVHQGEALFRTQGSMSTFGGPHDHDMSPSEGLALFSQADLTNPLHRDLFLPYQPPGTTGLGRRLNPDKLYLACRWDYHVTSRTFLRQTQARITNPHTGEWRMARPVDWGPSATSTHRVADLSPRLAGELGLATDQIVVVEILGQEAHFLTPAAFHAMGAAPATPPRIYSCSEWGARPAHVTHFAEHDAVGIVLHNTQYANRAPLPPDQERAAAFDNARAIQNDHMDNPKKHWADTGQHFTVSQGGVITEGRHGSVEAARNGRVVQAAHAESAHGEKNLKWFGIEIAGDNRQQYVVTQPQLDAVVELGAWLVHWAGVATLPIIGHKDALAGHTDCPGHIEDHLPEIRQAIATRAGQLG